MIDLIFTEIAGERLLAAIVAVNDSTDPSHFGPVAFKGGIGPLSEEISRSFPSLGTPTELSLRLTVIHFSNMASGQNAAGQAYPVKA